jgi:hypothetical protein
MLKNLLISGLCVLLFSLNIPYASAALGDDASTYYDENSPGNSSITITTNNTEKNPSYPSGYLGKYFKGYAHKTASGDWQFRVDGIGAMEGTYNTVVNGQTLRIYQSEGDQQGAFDIKVNATVLEKKEPVEKKAEPRDKEEVAVASEKILKEEAEKPAAQKESSDNKKATNENASEKVEAAPKTEKEAVSSKSQQEKESVKKENKKEIDDTKMDTSATDKLGEKTSKVETKEESEKESEPEDIKAGEKTENKDNAEGIEENQDKDQEKKQAAESESKVSNNDTEGSKGNWLYPVLTVGVIGIALLVFGIFKLKRRKK